MSRWIWFSAVLVLAASTVASAAPILLDFQGSTHTTQAGYTAMYNPKFYGSPTTELTLSDGVTVGWITTTTVTWSTKTDDKFPPSIPPTDLLRDWVNFGATGRQFQFRNLVPGLYNLTFWSVDMEWKDKNTQFLIDQDNDGTFEMEAVVDSRSLLEISKTVQVSVSQDGMLTIHARKNPSGSSGGGLLNGLELVVVPDPATLVLLLGGAGLAIVRRRR